VKGAITPRFATGFPVVQMNHGARVMCRWGLAVTTDMPDGGRAGRNGDPSKVNTACPLQYDSTVPMAQERDAY